MNKNCLLCDIGNTSIDFGFYEGNLLLQKKILSHDQIAIHKFLEEISSKTSFCMISSVNRHTTNSLLPQLEQFSFSYQLIQPDLMKQYSIDNKYTITNTDYLGTDLFCDVIAVENDPSIIIDLGTVGKVLLLDKGKLFRGAAIFPDIEQFPKMMDASTDLLKKYKLDSNPPLVSLKTEECISSGAIWGMCGLLGGYISQIKEQYNLNQIDVYLTGGSAFYIKDILPKFNIKDIIYNEALCLKGVDKLFRYTQNKKR